MFERYTEKGRRVIFYARKEASELGWELIEADFLLLGIARENPELCMRWLGSDYADLRKHVARRYTSAKRVPETVDMSLSDACGRVLAHAEEEADRLRDCCIGTEHLFLGLLRERGTTQRILKARHEDLNGVRKGIAGDPDRQEMKTARSLLDQQMKIVAEDGREVAIIPWPEQPPAIGETIRLLNAENVEITYRILNLTWHAGTGQTKHMPNPEILVTVRAEQS